MDLQDSFYEFLQWKGLGRNDTDDTFVDSSSRLAPSLSQTSIPSSSFSETAASFSSVSTTSGLQWLGQENSKISVRETEAVPSSEKKVEKEEKDAAFSSVSTQQVARTDGQETSQVEAFESKLLLSDEEILQLGVRKSDVEQFRRMRYQDSFSISSWFDQLRNFTFPSSFLALSYDEGRAIYDAHLKKARQNYDDILAPLQRRLDAAIGGRNVFLKLNTRSPKDVPVYDFDNPSVQKAVDLALDAVQVTPQMTALEVQNLQVAAFVAATQQCLKIKTGEGTRASYYELYLDLLLSKLMGGLNI